MSIGSQIWSDQSAHFVRVGGLRDPQKVRENVVPVWINDAAVTLEAIYNEDTDPDHATNLLAGAPLTGLYFAASNGNYYVSVSEKPLTGPAALALDVNYTFKVKMVSGSIDRVFFLNVITRRSRGKK